MQELAVGAFLKVEINVTRHPIPPAEEGSELKAQAPILTPAAPWQQSPSVHHGVFRGKEWRDLRAGPHPPHLSVFISEAHLPNSSVKTELRSAVPPSVEQSRLRIYSRSR